MSDELALRSATELIAALGRGEVSATELLDLYLDRCADLNHELNAVVSFDEATARAAAAQADRHLAGGSGAPVDMPLLGLPMTIKDALATSGLRSTGGASELADHVPDRDAEVVAKVRSAGAVIFAKTNLPRWSGDIQAYNDLFGTTVNPWDPTRTPGGSSGGASAAVAAGLCAAEIGTDIGGSIRLPAHFSGVCGHKPSYGIVPQLGYISHPTYPLAEADVNVVGPLARSVDDLELLLDVIAGPRLDLVDGWTLDLPQARHGGDPTKMRVGAHLDDPHVPVGSAVGAVLEEACQFLESGGISIDRDAWPEELDFGDVDPIGLPLVSAATSVSASDPAFDRLRSVALDPSAHPETTRRQAGATAMFHREWLRLVERREGNRRKWAAFFRRYDVLLAPVAINTAFEHQHDGGFADRTITVDGVDREYWDLVRWTIQFGYVGLPVTVVPVGLAADGLPVGIQIVGPHLGDRTTLAFARRVEQVLGGYQVPPTAVNR